MDIRKSVLEFGAYGDGMHDDYAPIQAALDSGAQEIYIPQGIYCIRETLKVPSNMCIVADKTAKVVMKSASRRKRNDFLLSNADAEKGNTNITVIGGIWDGNNTAPENAKPDLFDKNGYSGTVLNFVNVNGLTLQDLVLANSVTYYIRMCKVHHFTISDISFISDHFGVNQDGLHFGGDVKHGTVKNIRALSYGQTNDDLIALNADDSVERVENFDLCRDSIEDITFENLYAENCHTIIRLLSVTAAIRNIRFRNIYGGFRCSAINADAARYCKTPLFQEADHPNGVGDICNITIENFTCYPVLTLPEDFGGTTYVPRAALVLESMMDHVHISGFRYVRQAPDSPGCPAMIATNLTNQAVLADGTAYLLSAKENVLQLDQFTQLSINRSAAEAVICPEH